MKDKQDAFAELQNYIKEHVVQGKGEKIIICNPNKLIGLINAAIIQAHKEGFEAGRRANHDLKVHQRFKYGYYNDYKLTIKQLKQ